MKRCDRCQHGIDDTDPAGTAFVLCALIPPAPVPVSKVVENQLVTEIQWLRPAMKREAWCGQFKLSWTKLFRRGPRT